MSEPAKAVFLSYASQDAAAARKICDALRTAGVEVWFDQSELVGGDAWDAKIRQQIKECALFLPIISANTQARAEGYFRIEWRLADRRTEAMGKSKAFLVPISIDDTRDANADVPDSFLAVQWTRLPAGEANATFCERVKKLLGGPRDAGRSLVGKRDEGVASPVEAKTRRRITLSPWIAAAVVGIGFAGFTVVRLHPWGSSSTVPPVPAAHASQGATPAGEIERLRARLIPDQWKKEDFEPFSATLDRIIAADELNADAWALRSIINSLQVIRNFESGTKYLEAGRQAANRALYLAPRSGLGELALGMHLTAMNSRGGDPRAARPHLQQALAILPPDALTRFADVSWGVNSFAFAELRTSLDDWLQTDPSSNHAAFVRGMMHLALREPDEALRWAEKGATSTSMSGVRSFVTSFEVHYYLRADLNAARAALDRIAPGGPTVHRALYSRWLLAMAERRYEAALQELARTPESNLFDRYRGPKSLLAGMSYQCLGNSEAATAQFRDALRTVQEQLVSDPQDEDLRADLALASAYAGHRTEAQRELSSLEPLIRGRGRHIRAGQILTTIAQTHAVLGQIEPLRYWLRELLSGPAIPPFTPASLRLDPRFSDVIDKPELRTLMTEFAHLNSEGSALAPIAPAEKSIAVLAFDNRSDEKSDESFSDGMSEELLNVLSKVPGLTVKARNSSFYFKGRNATPQEIGKQLGVTHFVSGSVQKIGNSVRIFTQLSRTDTGDQIWTDRFNGELDKPWELQERIASRIAEELKLKLGASAQATKTVNPEAYRLVLEARYFLAPRTEAGFARAESAARRAIEIDPQFAKAHAVLADFWLLRSWWRVLDAQLPEAKEFGRARTEALLARQLDPALDEPLATLGAVDYHEGRFDRAEDYFQHALRQNPNNVLAIYWRAMLLRTRGQIDAAITELDRAERLDPMSFSILDSYSRYADYAHRDQDALVFADRALAIRPEVPYLQSNRALTLQRIGRKAEAVEAARAVRQNPAVEARRYADANAIYILRAEGLAEEAQEYGDKALRALPPGGYIRGMVLTALGRFDNALPCLETAPLTHFENFYFSPLWDSVRDDPRFQQLMVKLGCAAEYKVARATIARMLKERKEKK